MLGEGLGRSVMYVGGQALRSAAGQSVRAYVGGFAEGFHARVRPRLGAAYSGESIVGAGLEGISAGNRTGADAMIEAWRVQQRVKQGMLLRAPSNVGGGIVAQNGTKITGFTTHGVNRAIGDAAQRAGTTPAAILDALKNPQKITSGVDKLGRPFEIFTGQNARVFVNPQTGRIVSVNPLSGAGAH